jgi:hypothetical protein
VVMVTRPTPEVTSRSSSWWRIGWRLPFYLTGLVYEAIVTQLHKRRGRMAKPNAAAKRQLSALAAKAAANPRIREMVRRGIETAKRTEGVPVESMLRAKTSGR